MAHTLTIAEPIWPMLQNISKHLISSVCLSCYKISKNKLKCYVFLTTSNSSNIHKNVYIYIHTLQKLIQFTVSTVSLLSHYQFNRKTRKATPTKHGVHQVKCILKKQIEPFSENSFYFYSYKRLKKAEFCSF